MSRNKKKETMLTFGHKASGGEGCQADRVMSVGVIVCQRAAQMILFGCVVGWVVGCLVHEASFDDE
jgi:hypothetical protein